MTMSVLYSTLLAIQHWYKNDDNNTKLNPASILRKSISGRHRPVSYPDGPMTARYGFT